MRDRPTSVPSERSGRVLGWFAAATLVAIALTAGSDAHVAYAQSASPNPEVTPSPTPSPGPTPTPVPTATPPELSPFANIGLQVGLEPHGSELRAFGPIWKYSIEVDGGTVVQGQSVPETRLLGDVGNIYIELKGESARVVLNQHTPKGFKFIRVGCTGYTDRGFPVPVTIVGTSVSFVIHREGVVPGQGEPEYFCFFWNARTTVPPTSTIGPTPARPDGLGRVALAILAGLVAGVLVRATYRSRGHRT